MKRVAALLLVITINCTLSTVNCQLSESRAYLYAGSSDIYRHNVLRTDGALNLICPDYFEISASGTLMNTRTPDKAFIAEMRAKGVKVLPFVANHWDMAKARAALANREYFAAQIAAAVAAYDLDGIDIDIENINHNDRANYTAFIKLLREKLPANKTLSVCVAANPWGLTSGWQGAYDYAALGKYADTVFIMTYDQSYEGGAAGPVASLDFIAKSVDWAAKYVDKGKIMLGVPFYGRYWIKGAASGGKAFTLSDIDRMVRDYKSTVWYDGANDCARATMTVTAGDLTAGLWGGKKLTAGTYDIWYENETSVEKKLKLVRNKGIKGAGVWALGYEYEELWRDYPRWISGWPFADIEKHWARSEISAAYDAGLVVGDGKRFYPDNNITRAEVCVMLCRLLGVTASAGASGFADSKGHWADGYIKRLRDADVVNGYSAAQFKPNAAITRQETAMILSRVLNVPDTADFNESIFADVSPKLTPQGNNAIVLLAALGVLKGDGVNFHPHSSITRAECAAVFVRVMDKPLRLPAVKPVIEPR